jgi:serine/threonine protein kinase
MHVTDQQKLPDYYKSIITDLLNGLSDIHGKHIIHCKLSDDNIVVVRDGNNQLSAKYIDFEMSRDLDIEPAKFNGATYLYMSAEMFFNYLNTSTVWDDPYSLSKPSYGLDVFNENIKKGKILPSKKIPADYKDDVWALGIIIFKLLTGYYPQAGNLTDLILSVNPLLQGMLAKTREARFSASEALECWQENPELVRINYKSVRYQTKINFNLLELKDALQNNFLIKAIDLLGRCIKLNNEIADQQDVHTLGYISTQNMQESLDLLNVKLAEHNEFLPMASAQVLKYLRNNIKKFNGSSLTEDILTQVERLLKEHWPKLYAVNMNDFAVGLSNEINVLRASANRCSAIVTCFRPHYNSTNFDAIMELIPYYVLNAKPSLNEVLELPLMNLVQQSSIRNVM